MKWRTASPSRPKRAVPSGRKPSPCWSRIATQRFVRGLQAVDALAALGREERDDVVAGSDEGHVRPDRLDDARALVAEHARRVPARIGARRRVEVGVADAARLDPDEHLPGLRVGQLDAPGRRAARRTPRGLRREPARKRSYNSCRVRARVVHRRPRHAGSRADTAVSATGGGHGAAGYSSRVTRPEGAT